MASSVQVDSFAWATERAFMPPVRSVPAFHGWRHSWTAMSFSSCWLQKLSLAVAKQTAFGALRRTTLCTRQRVLQGANESGDGDYESVIMGRAAAM